MDWFEGKKIIMPSIVNGSSYSLDMEGFYSNDKTSIVISENLSYLISILNSKVLWWLTQQLTSGRQGGFYELKPMYVTDFPVPQSDIATETIITYITDALLLLVSQPQTPSLALNVAYLERVLDAMVYELYLPAELHTLGYEPFKVISAYPWPTLSGDTVKDLAALAEVFAKWYDPEHPIRRLTYYLDSVPAVRIIEGKEETDGGAEA